MLKKYQEFLPKSFFFLRRYTFSFFKGDLLAGLTVGIVSIPLAMAFAMASGVPPERGLYTAIVAGFIISFFGGSRLQIGGPTGAFVVVVYGILQRHGYDGLILATLLAGLMLIVMGLCRLGELIKYVPHPLVLGFTAGIACVIFSSQMNDFFGLGIDHLPADFVEKWRLYLLNFSHLDLVTTMLALGALSVIVFTRSFFPKVPWGIVAIVGATAVVWVFDLPVQTITDKFGVVPSSLPTPTFSFDWSRIREVFPDALTIAFLAGIESLLSAVIADSMVGSRHKSNCELVAQGLANIGSVVFGGIPATAAIARTATNIRTGGKTPVAGMIHALVVWAALVWFSPLVGRIPLAALAALLVMVAWTMSELPHFVRLLRAPKADVVIYLAAFFLTVFIDITVAVEVGMVLAAFFFMKEMGEVRPFKRLDSGVEERAVYELKGPLFFGVTSQLRDLEHSLEKAPKQLVLRMKHVSMLDGSGLYALHSFHERMRQQGTELILQEVGEKPHQALERFGLGALIQR